VKGVAGRCVVGLAAALSALALPSSTTGNGGALRLARAPAGPFLVSAWTRPDPPRVGRVDVSVAVMRPESGEAVLDAEVDLATERADGPAGVVTTVAGRAGGGNLLLYHGEMDLPEPGRWRVTVSVRSPAGPGTAAFEVTVVRAAPVTWFLLAVIGGTLVLWLGWRRARARTAPGDEPGHQGEAHH
jgi:hypothetical protein